MLCLECNSPLDEKYPNRRRHAECKRRFENRRRQRIEGYGKIPCSRCGKLRVNDKRGGLLCRECIDGDRRESTGRKLLVKILVRALAEAFRAMEPLRLTRIRCGGPAKSIAHHKAKRKEVRRRLALNGFSRTHRKRARKFGVAYEPIKFRLVWERDGGRCKLCGRPTPWELRGKYAPDAPELGHIVPPRRGGPHTYDNVECECRECNIDKGFLTNAEYFACEGLAYRRSKFSPAKELRRILLAPLLKAAHGESYSA